MGSYPRNKTNEIVGVVLVALTAIAYFSLFSFHPLDPALNVSAPTSQYQNLIGWTGAWLADLLLQLFGWAAFLLPFPLFMAGYRKVRGQEIQYFYLKILGFFALLFGACSALSLFEPPMLGAEHHLSGGLLGLAFSDLLVGYLNRTGSILAVVTVVLLGLLLSTRFSVEASLNWLSSRNWIRLPDFSRRWSSWQRRRGEKREFKNLRKSRKEVITQSMPKKVTLEETPQQSDPAAPGGAPPVRVKEEAAPQVEELATPDEPDEPTYQFPSHEFLLEPEAAAEYDEQDLVDRAYKLSAKCAEFEVNGKVLQIHPGPVVTTFEFKPDPGVKYSRITTLSDDLCLALKAESVRIDRVPGKNTVGIEVPNQNRRTIHLKEIIDTSEYQRSTSKLTLGLGQLINGGVFVADLAKMPHLLIAGSTGSGKSVGLNCMVCSILYKATPDEVRFIMVDPKRLELGLYEDIPHLLIPIVTNPKKAANALNWAVREMEARYRLLAQWGVRNIEQFNLSIREGRRAPEDSPVTQPLPYIVILVDELADLMMTAGKEVEASVTRLAQMARAVGIHLILATQRPSVDVITGLIKANFPSRISFRVSSKIDSRTILDANGAEKLLGMGDMLYLSPSTARLVRLHGPLITEQEISRIVTFLKDQAEPDYQEEILLGDEDESDSSLVDVADLEDPLFEEAARFVVESRRASTSLLQRRFRIGYGRAARLLDMMENEGLIGPSEGSKAREVLVPIDYYEAVDHRGE
jgi:S-DNA-T family DNA segregation ATPase FtsK/SpoIIIE